MLSFRKPGASNSSATGPIGRAFIDRMCYECNDVDRCCFFMLRHCIVDYFTLYVALNSIEILIIRNIHETIEWLCMVGISKYFEEPLILF